MQEKSNIFMPPARSTLAGEVDALFYFIYYASIFFFLLVIVTAAYFIFRYRRRGRKTLTSGVDHNIKLEILWTVIPAVLVFIVFFWGFRTFMKMHIVPSQALEIKVTGQKWFWSFDYPNGAITTNELIVPANQPVKLLMSSQDVIHSFFVPDFRVKKDVLPNRYTVTWFEANHPGEHQIFCAEYCGTSHSDMLGKVIVKSDADYQVWLQESLVDIPEGMSMEEAGEQLYTSKACITCHSIDGSPGTGPSLKGRAGNQIFMSDGSEVLMDENYMRESILNPQAKIAEGYQPVMPTFQGVLTDRQVDALIAYIKSIQ